MNILQNKALEEIIIAIAIFLIFLIFRKFFSKYIVKILLIFTSKTKNTFDNRIIEILIEPIKQFIVLFGLYISFQYASFYNEAIYALLKSAVIYIVFSILFDSVDIFENTLKKVSLKFGKDLHEEINLFLVKAIKIFVFVFGLVAILQIWDINISAFIASLGLGGLAFALAAKDTAANLFGGLTLLADKSLKMEDWIKVDSIEGVVETIGLRTTKIRSFEKTLITVPNQILANTPVENFSRRGVRRIKFRVGLTYDTSSIIMKKIVKDITTMLETHEDIAQDQTMLVRFDKFEDSSLSIFIYTFTSTANWARYLEIKEDVNIKIMAIIEQNNSEFSFPSQTLYIKKDNNDI